jgi:hypothetical protein
VGRDDAGHRRLGLRGGHVKLLHTAAEQRAEEKELMKLQERWANAAANERLLGKPPKRSEELRAEYRRRHARWVASCRQLGLRTSEGGV